jgi:hypothetical protein
MRVEWNEKKKLLILVLREVAIDYRFIEVGLKKVNELKIIHDIFVEYWKVRKKRTFLSR